jgi:hypothetical protein
MSAGGSINHHGLPGEARETECRRAAPATTSWGCTGVVVADAHIVDTGQAAVEFECLAYWQERGQPSPGRHKHELPRAGREVLVDGDGRSLDLDLLRAMLPARRQRVLFGPGGPAARLRLLLAGQRGAPAARDSQAAP